MIILSSTMIEQAHDELTDANYREQHAWVWPAQQKELHGALSDQSDDFKAGYELGLQAARVFLQGNPSAIKAGVQF